MPTQALRDALAVAELPPLVCPEREEVGTRGVVHGRGAGCRRITQPEQAEYRPALHVHLTHHKKFR